MTGLAFDSERWAFFLDTISHMLHLLRIGVLRGGPSSEYDVSLASGGEVLRNLREFFADKYQPVDVFVDKHGVWHMDGVPIKPEEALRRIDLAFNVLHGTYGEDGKVQSFLEAHNMPFTGSGSLASAVGMNKVMSKKVFKDNNIKSPYWKEIPSKEIEKDPESMIQKMFQSFTLPAVVKPVSSGSSVGVSIVRAYTEFPKALAEAAKYSDAVLIEEYIPGVEATCGVIEGFRGDDLYALPPVEIRPAPKDGFYSYGSKYDGTSQKIVPATFSDKTKKELEELAKKIHRALGLRHYSRSDFIIHPRRGIYVLEVNTLPGLTSESSIPRALRAVGSDTHELIDALIQRVMKRL